MWLLMIASTRGVLRSLSWASTWAPACQDKIKTHLQPKDQRLEILWWSDKIRISLWTLRKINVCSPVTKMMATNNMKQFLTTIIIHRTSHLHQHVADFQQTSLSSSVESRAFVLRVRLVRWIYTLHWHTHHKICLWYIQLCRSRWKYRSWTSTHSASAELSAPLLAWQRGRAGEGGTEVSSSWRIKSNDIFDLLNPLKLLWLKSVKIWTPTSLCPVLGWPSAAPPCWAQVEVHWGWWVSHLAYREKAPRCPLPPPLGGRWPRWQQRLQAVEAAAAPLPALPNHCYAYEH